MVRNRLLRIAECGKYYGIDIAHMIGLDKIPNDKGIYEEEKKEDKETKKKEKEKGHHYHHKKHRKLKSVADVYYNEVIEIDLNGIGSVSERFAIETVKGLFYTHRGQIVEKFEPLPIDENKYEAIDSYLKGHTIDTVEFHMTLLSQAILLGDREMVQYLILKGASTGFVEDTFVAPLALAASADPIWDSKIMTILLNSGSCPMELLSDAYASQINFRIVNTQIIISISENRDPQGDMDDIDLIQINIEKIDSMKELVSDISDFLLRYHDRINFRFEEASENISVINIMGKFGISPEIYHRIDSKSIYGTTMYFSNIVFNMIMNDDFDDHFMEDEVVYYDDSLMKLAIDHNNTSAVKFLFRNRREILSHSKIEEVIREFPDGLPNIEVISNVLFRTPTPDVKQVRLIRAVFFSEATIVAAIKTPNYDIAEQFAVFRRTIPRHPIFLDLEKESPETIIRVLSIYNERECSLPKELISKALMKIVIGNSADAVFLINYCGPFVKQLLNEPFGLTADPTTPLIRALKRRYNAISNILIDLSDLTAVDSNGLSALHWTIILQNHHLFYKIYHIILEEDKELKGVHPIFIALTVKNTKAIEEILENEDVSTFRLDSFDPIQYACFLEYSTGIGYLSPGKELDLDFIGSQFPDQISKAISEFRENILNLQSLSASSSNGERDVLIKTEVAKAGTVLSKVFIIDSYAPPTDQ